MPDTFYILAAAMNFEDTVLDTHDLCTQRGGSLALLRLPDGVAGALEEELSAEKATIAEVYTGASEGLWSVTLPDLEVPEADAPPSVSAEDLAENCDITVEKAQSILDGKKPKGMSNQKYNKYKNILDKMVTSAVPKRDPETLTTLMAAAETACRTHLAEATDLCGDLFTFGVAVTQARAGESFPQTWTRLQAQVRCHQFQAATLVLPPPGAPDQTEACAFNGLAPALAEKVDGKGGRLSLCDSVRRRRNLGRQAKQRFYTDELQGVADRLPPEDTARDILLTAATRLREARVGFTRSFAHLVDKPPSGLPPTVTGKMALIYLDGNNFGARRRAFARTPEYLTAFSHTVQRHRALLLAALLDWALETPGMRVAAGDDDDGQPVLRLETLLWGGDETMWVVPAWLAWEAMGVIQRHLADWPPPKGPDKTSLSHGAGMLFCPHKAPIRDMRNLATALGDAAKNKQKNGASQEINFVQALVLDTLDTPDPEPEPLRDRLYEKEGPPVAAYSLCGADWDVITKEMARARATFGRSQLYALMRQGKQKGAFVDGSPETGKRFFASAVERLKELAGIRLDEDERLKILNTPLLGGREPEYSPLVRLHQMVELWDFVADPAATNGRAAA